MPSCFVVNCKNNNKRRNGIKFHIIPRRLKTEWLRLIGRDTNTFVIQQRVCSEHFVREDYENCGGLKTTLKPTAVPSRNLPNPFQYVPAEQPPTSNSKDQSILLHEHDISDVYNIVAVKHYIESLPDESEMIIPVVEEVAASDKSAVHPSSSLVKLEPTSESDYRFATQLVIAGNKRKRKEDSGSETSGGSSSKKCSQTSPAKSNSSASLSTKVRIVEVFHSYSRGPDYCTQQKSVRKRKIKIRHLKSVIHKLAQECLLSENALSVLENTFDGVSLATMKRMIANRNISLYPPELRSFAMTLHFYSSKAYDFVKRTFNLSLPTQLILREWLSKIDCTPGFSEPAIKQLHKTAEEYYNNNKKPLLLALCLDEMSLKKEISAEKNCKNIWGYVDFGADIQYSNSLELATEALVLMVVGVNLNFRLPIAYFFINKLTVQEKTNIIREALHYLKSTHFKIISLTCDGPHVNLKMMTELGCNVNDPDNLQTHFMHPETGYEVFVLFDVCHMLKLMKNNWVTTGIFVDPDGKEINWIYVEKLFELQENQGFNLGNMLPKKHMKRKQLMMRVTLATHALSANVADALDFLCKTLQLEEFKGAEGTINFIRTIDKLFNLLNSRHPYAKDMKTPLKVETEHSWKPFIENSVQYLLKLKDRSGKLLRSTTKRVPFLGFAITSLSLLAIYKQEVVDFQTVKHILTYKFSQDHLELFFQSIRSRNGWSNNLNCLQFMMTYRRILLPIDAENNTGNCLAKDQTNILTLTSTKKKIELTDIHLERISENDCTDIVEAKIELFLPVQFKEFEENVVAYIAKFVIKIVDQRIKCALCKEALRCNLDECDMSLQLIGQECRGGLMLPSSSLRRICRIVERKLQMIMRVENLIPSNGILFSGLLRDTRELFLNENIFPVLTDHCFDSEPLESSHKLILIREIIKSYGSIRINSLTRQQNELKFGKKGGQELNMLI